MSIVNEPPIHPDLFNQLKSMQSQFSSRMKYEATIRLMWCGVPHQLAVERVESADVVEKVVYEFDPVSQNLLRSKKINLWGDILSLAEAQIDTVLDRGYNFLFYGANGSGKTHSAIQFLCSSIEAGKSGYYITLRDLYLLYNEVNFKEPTEVDAQLLSYIQKADVLVLDEVGKETLSAPVISFIEDLIKSRSARACSTFICSNIPVQKQEFLSRYGNSVWDVIRGCYFVYQFSADGDYRSKFRRQLEL